LLSCQLIFTLGYNAAAISLIPNYKEFLIDYPYIVAIAIIVSIITTFGIVCFSSIARSCPINYIFLFLFTLCETYLVSYIVTFSPKINVLIALGLTCTVVIALTIYAFYTKTDFTYLGGMLFVCGLLLIVVFIMALLFKSRIMFIIYSTLALIIFSIYLIYDT